MNFQWAKLFVQIPIGKLKKPFACKLTHYLIDRRDWSKLKCLLVFFYFFIGFFWKFFLLQILSLQSEFPVFFLLETKCFSVNFFVIKIKSIIVLINRSCLSAIFLWSINLFFEIFKWSSIILIFQLSKLISFLHSF